LLTAIILYIAEIKNRVLYFWYFLGKNNLLLYKTELVEAFDLISHTRLDFSSYEIDPNSLICHKKLGIVDISENGNQLFATKNGEVKFFCC
jgi:asparagine synthetase B (glutamine-hydrolysing)